MRWLIVAGVLFVIYHQGVYAENECTSQGNSIEVCAGFRL